jgi:hypothetical protein
MGVSRFQMRSRSSGVWGILPWQCTKRLARGWQQLLVSRGQKLCFESCAGEGTHCQQRWRKQFWRSVHGLPPKIW